MSRPCPFDWRIAYADRSVGDELDREVFQSIIVEAMGHVKKAANAKTGDFGRLVATADKLQEALNIYDQAVAAYAPQ